MPEHFRAQACRGAGRGRPGKSRYMQPSADQMPVADEIESTAEGEAERKEIKEGKPVAVTLRKCGVDRRIEILCALQKRRRVDLSVDATVAWSPGGTPFWFKVPYIK